MTNLSPESLSNLPKPQKPWLTLPASPPIWKKTNTSKILQMAQSSNPIMILSELFSLEEPFLLMLCLLTNICLALIQEKKLHLALFSGMKELNDQLLTQERIKILLSRSISGSCPRENEQLLFHPIITGAKD
jgi:hypothetical protein